MDIIDFRFRPNTPEIINGIKNSAMFKAACKAIGFDARTARPLPDIVADLDRLGVERPWNEHHADMVEDQDREGTDAQPVQAEMAGDGGRGNHIAGSVQHRL